jgi:gliding motility-associated-like protein
MNKYRLLLIYFCTSLSVFSQSNTFYRKYNLSGMNGGLALRATQDGGFVAVGQHEGNGSAGGCDIYVYRVDECGNRLWFKMIGEAGTDGAKSIQELPNGDFLIAGHYDGSLGFVGKLDANGNLLWLKTYAGLEWIFHAVETNNGDIVCVGKQPGTSCVLMRLDSFGNVLWSKSFTDFGEMPLYVEELEGGEIVFACTHNIPGKDMALAKTDASGNVLWSKGYGFGYTDTDHTTWSCAAAIDEQSNKILITTPSQNIGGMSGDNILVVEADLNNGGVIWSKVYGGNGSDQSRAVTATPQGFVICGNTDSYPVMQGANATVTEDMLERNILLMHIDVEGDILWSRQYGAAARDKGIGVAHGVDGSYTMSAYTGSSFFGNPDGSMDPLFIKTDSVGMVNCQTADCPLLVADVASNISNIGTGNTVIFNALQRNPVVVNYTPDDVYQCQDCYTVPYFESSDTVVCVSDTISFYNLTTIGLICFQEWQIDGQTIFGNNDTLNYFFNTPGEHDVYLNSSCGTDANSFHRKIYVKSKPNLNSIPADTMTCLQPDVTLNHWVDLAGNSSFGYAWYDENSSLLSGGDNHPVVSNPGVYTLVAVNPENNCIDSLRFEVLLDSSKFFEIDKIQCTNIVTRNDDGANDCWKIFHEYVPSDELDYYIDVQEILIFNRWGKLISETKEGFSVCNDLEGLSNGTYYYIAHLESTCLPKQEFKKSGWFLLNR